MKIDIKKHRKLIGTYIKCSQCGELNNEPTCRIYLEDNRYRTQCVRCGKEDYLKTQHL